MILKDCTCGTRSCACVYGPGLFTYITAGVKAPCSSFPPSDSFRIRGEDAFWVQKLANSYVQKKVMTFFQQTSHPRDRFVSKYSPKCGKSNHRDSKIQKIFLGRSARSFYNFRIFKLPISTHEYLVYFLTNDFLKKAQYIVQDVCLRHNLSCWHCMWCMSWRTKWNKTFVDRNTHKLNFAKGRSHVVIRCISLLGAFSQSQRGWHRIRHNWKYRI